MSAATISVDKSDDESNFFDVVSDVASTIAVSQIDLILNNAVKHGFEAAGLPDFYERVDFHKLIRLIPTIVEFVEQYDDLSGNQKKVRAIALVVAIARAAKQNTIITEENVQILVDVIEVSIDLSKTKFAINKRNQIAICFKNFLQRLHL